MIQAVYNVTTQQFMDSEKNYGANDSVRFVGY
jgi:hypothetical protein